MSSFQLTLEDSYETRRYENVTSFVAEDGSGSFGIQAGHQRMMSSLVFGMARFRQEDADWQYLALPEAILYFSANELIVNTRRCLISQNYEDMVKALTDTLVKEEQDLATMKHNLHRIEDYVLKRILDIDKDRQ